MEETDMDRLRKLVHYICWKVDHPSQLGSTKLNKIIWYADTLSYRATGQSITQARFKKLQHGPVPMGMPAVIAGLEADGLLIKREAEFYGRVKHDLIATAPADGSFMSDDERVLVDEVITAICEQHTATSISELTHDSVWDAAEMGEEIPLYAVLAAQAAEITEEDMAWANSVIEERNAAA
jgi:hypothetical protein